MSSGVEADIALDAAVIATLGLARLMGGTAGVAGLAANMLADLAQRKADVRAEAIRRAERDEEVVQGVLARNSAIAALRESRDHHRAMEIDLPEPLEVTGHDVAELSAWCERVDTELTGAERALSEAVARAAAAQILPAAGASLHLAAAQEREPAASPLPRVLGRLLPDVTEDDRRRVMAAAERAEAEPGEAETHLGELRLRIQEANCRARDRRDERSLAARLARELAELPGAEDVLAALGDVVAGARGLDATLREEAFRLRERARAADEQRYIATAISHAFADLGYEVTEGFETLTVVDGEATLTRGDWPQHAVKVRVEGTTVRAAMVRTTPAESLDQRRLDVEREKQWCSSFEAARAKLAASGISADVRWRLEPGVQQLPVATPGRRSAKRPAERRRAL